MVVLYDFSDFVGMDVVSIDSRHGDQGVDSALDSARVIIESA